MGLLDKVLAAPGKVAETAAEAAVRIPAVPLDVASKAIDGVDKGMSKVIAEDVPKRAPRA